MKKQRDLDNFVLSLRLKGAEAMRFWTVMDLAKNRDGYAERTDVIRELLGLNKPYYLTESEIEYFQTGEKSNINSELIYVEDKGKLDDDTKKIRKAG